MDWSGSVSTPGATTSTSPRPHATGPGPGRTRSRAVRPAPGWFTSTPRSARDVDQLELDTVGARMSKILQGVRVIEVAQWWFVPAAGAVLADWGADVIKIEHPVTGDPQRGLVTSGLVPPTGGVNFMIEQPNRGKRSVGLDLAHRRGRELLCRLVETADVFLTNFLPAARRRLAIDVDDIRRVNPRIIYVRGHGQGPRGPDAEKGGYDAASFWCRGGIANALTPPGAAAPVMQRAAFGDSAGAMTVAGGVAAALFHRERSGEPSVVDVSLLGTAMWIMAPDIIAATNRVAEGNLSARTTLAYENSELGQMARAFDNLAQALEKRQVEAVESAQRIHKQRQQQEVLYDLNRGITSTLDLGSVLSILLDHIATLFPTCAVTVSWINKQTNDLEPIARRGFDDIEQTETDLESAQLLPLLVLKQQSPVAISNARRDPDASNHDFLLRHKLTSYLGLPLLAKREILGVLSFYTREEREFSHEEIDFLNALVNEAAIAIYNSRLFEQTREQAIELEQSNKIKDEFLGVMSHELRTPLNIIMNYSEALKMGTFGDISPDQERGTEKIRAQASHLLSLINGILEITKIESGTAIVQTDHLDIVDFMSEAKSDYMLPMEKDLILDWDYATDLPIMECDRVKLKQILINLINNAIKFTDRGYVRVSAHALVDEGILEFRVADTGPGIPNELLPFIFEKFRQIDSATTRNYSGAGLGLYIVKNFVELLGGTIDAQSKVGVGSVFTVRLPMQPRRARTQTVHSQPKPAVINAI